MFLSFVARNKKLLTGSNSGFQVYELPPATTFRRVNSSNDSAVAGGVSFIALHERSDNLVIVLQNSSGGQAENRVLIIFDQRSKSVLSQMQFECPILGIRVNNAILAVIMEKRTHLFKWDTLEPLPQIITTAPLNTLGLGALSPCSETGHATWYAWPTTDQKESRGDLAVMDLTTTMKLSVIPASQNAVSALEWNGDGSMIAAVSTKGTMIRVFNREDGKLRYTFRRGANVATVYALSFSPNGAVLAACSYNGTLHLFRLEDDNTSLVAEVDGARSFAKVSIKEKRVTIAAISEDATKLFFVTVPTAGQEAVVEEHDILKDKTKRTSEYRIR